ncbi:unnamed protein product, partial [Rotaria socialis]
PKRQEKPATPKREETNHDDNHGNNNRQDSFHEQEQEQQSEAPYRSSSPPIPTLKNKGKKQKATTKNAPRRPSLDDDNLPPPPPPQQQQQKTFKNGRRQPPPEDDNHQQQQQPLKNGRRQPSFDDGNQQQQAFKNVRRQPSYDDFYQQQSPSPPPLPPLHTNDDYMQPPIDDANDKGRHTYRKPPTPRQPDVSSARKKPPQTFRPRPRADSNAGMPMRTISTTSLRSDGSDSEVLNRLEHLKRQLKDKEARLQEHVTLHQNDSNNQSSQMQHQSKSSYQPPAQPPVQRKSSPQFLMNAARVHHHRDSPTTNDKMHRLIHTDDDVEFKPGYFRDDAVLMGGNHGHNDNDYYSPPKRVDSGNRMFMTNIEKEASRRRYGADPTGFYDEDDPSTVANYELNRIAAQNEQRLKKLRDLENDDASLIDSNEVLERFQQKQRMQRGGSQTTLQDDAWLK